MKGFFQGGCRGKREKTFKTIFVTFYWIFLDVYSKKIFKLTGNLKQEDITDLSQP